MHLVTRSRINIVVYQYKTRVYLMGRQAWLTSGFCVCVGGCQGPVVFPNMDALLKVSYNMPVGTMAYVADQEYAYLRVGQGWRYIQVCPATFFMSTLPGDFFFSFCLHKCDSLFVNVSSRAAF